MEEREQENVFTQLRKATVTGRVELAVREYLWILNKPEPLDLDKNAFQLKVAQALDWLRAHDVIRAYHIETNLKQKTVTLVFTYDSRLLRVKMVIPW